MKFSKKKIYHFKGPKNKGIVKYEFEGPVRDNYAIWMNGALCFLAKTNQGVSKKWKIMKKKYGLEITKEEKANSKD